MNNSTKVRFSLDKNGFFAGSAVILLILTAICRVIGCWGIWNDRINAVMLVLLPVCCCVLMILCILLFGRKGFFLSIIPVLLGVVFFVFNALNYDNWIQTVLCILLYVTVAVVYTATVFGWLHTKWLLPPLFGLPLLYHIVFIDIPALNNVESPVSFKDGMQEMSVLCVLAAMLCVGLGLRKRPARVRGAAAAAASDAAASASASSSAKPAAPAQSFTSAQPAAPVEDISPDYFEEEHSPSLTLETNDTDAASAETDSEESSHD